MVRLQASIQRLPPDYCAGLVLCDHLLMEMEKHGRKPYS